MENPFHYFCFAFPKVTEQINVSDQPQQKKKKVGKFKKKIFKIIFVFKGFD